MAPLVGKRKATERHRVLGKKGKRDTVLAPSTESAPKLHMQSVGRGCSHTVWLDALPQDICVRIAAYITRDRDSGKPEFLNEDALALAETSSNQRRVMEEALDHTPDLRYGNLKLWLKVFESPVYIDAREGRGNAVLHLLACPTLRAAQIANRGNHFTSIAAGNSIAELSIHLERFSKSRYISMLEALQKLSYLVSLSIICDPLQACAFEYTIDSQDAYNRLAKACPRLTALHICCMCTRIVDHTPVVEAFPSLKELTIGKPLHDSALPYLRSRESVVLQTDRGSRCRYASEIGSSVTGIKFPEPKWSYESVGKAPFSMDHVDEEEVALLENCPRLRELDLVLCPGAEKRLPQSSLYLSLQLYWNIDVHGDELSTWLERPLDGFLIRRLYAQPLLQKLALVGAPVRMDDLAAVLRTIGKSLEELTTSLTGQPDNGLVRLLGIIDAVIRYNGKLQILRVVEPNWLEWSKLVTCVSSVSIEDKKAFLPQFHFQVRRLQRKNPWFDPATLFESVHHVITQCEDVIN